MVTMTLYARQQKRHRCIGQSFGLCGDGKGGMICENSIETCILPYVKQIASPSSMHETGCSGMMQWDDPEGSEVGGGFRVADTCTPMADSCQCMAKSTPIL